MDASVQMTVLPADVRALSAAETAAVSASLMQVRTLRKRLDGETAAMRKAVAAIRELTGRLEQLLIDLPTGIETQLADLALAIAQKVICQEIEGGHCRIDPIVQQVLSELDLGQIEAVVHLNPADLSRSELESSDAERSGRVRFVADGEIPSGACKVHTAQGHADSSILARLEQVRRAILALPPDKTDGH